MTSYRVTARREDGWWIVEVPELDIVTQARRVDQVEGMARDLIAAWLDVDQGDVAVDMSVELPQAWRGDAKEALAAKRDLERAAGIQAEAAARIRGAAEGLRRRGVSVRDLGFVLGVSPQRVSQLLKTPPREPENKPAPAPAARTEPVLAGRAPRQASVSAVAKKARARRVVSARTSAVTAKVAGRGRPHRAS